MRAGNLYRCPTCGDQSSHTVPCFRCDAVPLDEHGRPPPPLFERKILHRGLAAAERDAGARGVGNLIIAAASLARRIAQMRRLRRHRAEMRAVLPTPIAETRGPMARVAGRVQVLEPADPGRPTTAFALERVRERGANGSCAVETRTCCGKFLIHDDSGAALVDDDFVVVLPAPGTSLPANGGALIAAEEGQRAEVCGMATRRVVPELGQLGWGQGYRKGPDLLCFDGSPDRLLLLRPLE